MERKVGKIIDPQTRQEIERFVKKDIFEKEGIWQPKVRELVYKGIKGEVYYYYDGIADHIFFVGFPLGKKWDKLVRSLQALKREPDRGKYEIEVGEKGRGVRISFSYSDKDYPKQPGKSFLENRFKEIWQDLEQFLPRGAEGVVLGEPEVIKEFDLRDLSVRN